MIEFRSSSDRGVTATDWLTSHHSFSFNAYFDRERMHFGPLRVLNDDRVVPGGGFPTHPHENMEIVTYVLDGALAHRDSMGTSSVISAGDVQRMSAGTGVTHSEFNHSGEAPVHFLQIWFFPRRRGSEPSYEQRDFGRTRRTNVLLPVASGAAVDDALSIDQDATIYVCRLEADRTVSHAFTPERAGYLYVVDGRVRVGDRTLEGGDAALCTAERSIDVAAESDAELVLFEVAGV
jgi:redox-sensitive bicupin YhaK (pirin superfamily)